MPSSLRSPIPAALWIAGRLAFVLALASAPVCACRDASSQNRYFGILDDWVARNGPADEIQSTVVGTCGKLVIETATLTEQLTLPTTRRDEFHFRVDVCTKMTVHRAYRQPEFDDAATVSLLCDRSRVNLYKSLCKRARLRE